VINNDLNKVLTSNFNIKVNQNQNNSDSDSDNINVKSFEDILKQTFKSNVSLASDLRLRQFNISSENKTKLEFSKHAIQRLAQRNIEIDEEITEKLTEGVSRAAAKNIKNALVLSLEEDTAYIVSVTNGVVVTAMNSDDMRENVITNIDGTVII